MKCNLFKWNEKTWLLVNWMKTTKYEMNAKEDFLSKYKIIVNITYVHCLEIHAMFPRDANLCL